MRAGGTLMRILALGGSSRSASRVRRRLARASFARSSSIAAAAATCGLVAGVVRADELAASFLSTVFDRRSDVVRDIIIWLLALPATDRSRCGSIDVSSVACVEQLRVATRKRKASACKQRDAAQNWCRSRRVLTGVRARRCVKIVRSRVNFVWYMCGLRQSRDVGGEMSELCE